MASNTMAFWLFDSSFAANFFHNLSNFTLSKAADVLFLSDLKIVFIDSEEDKDRIRIVYAIMMY